MKLISTLLLLVTLCLGSIAWSQQDTSDNGDSDITVTRDTGEGETGINGDNTDIIEDEDDDQTTAYTDLQLTDEQYERLARGIFNVINNMSEKYFVSDSISLTFYILRYLSEIGEYEIVYKDIVTLINGFLKLAEYELSEDVWDIIHQIRKLKFGKKSGKHWVKIYAKDEKKGILYNINEDMSGNLVKHMTIQNGAEATFEDVVSKSQKKSLLKFLKEKVRFIGFRLSAINQVFSGIPKNIEFHMNKESIITPVKAEFKGINVLIKTDSIFKHIDFKLKKAYSVPGFKDGEDPLPSTVLYFKEKLMPLKVSIDQ